MIRTNGRVVEGHVESPTPEEAYAALSDNGIVTESLRPDPRPDVAPESEPDDGPQPGFRQAIDSALDSASHQVNFDSLTEQYRGKKVWVLDRDKIRKRVAQVVDQVLAEAQQKSESDIKTRELVAEAIKGMFADNRNIASERSAESIAAERAAAAAERAAAAAAAAAERNAQDRAVVSPPPAPRKPLPASAELEAQIAKLASVVIKAESALGAIIAASRRVGRGGGGGGGRRGTASGPIQNEQNEVLLEIFKTNLALQHGVEGEVLDVSTAEDAADVQAGEGETGPTDSADAGTAGTSNATAAGDDGPFPFLEGDGGADAGGASGDRGSSGNGSGSGRR
jgi:hypothetical protein